MGPKKKKGKPEVIVGQYAVSEMTEAELRDYALKLNEEIERTKEKVEVVCKEKQSLDSFWHITQKKLDQEKRKLVAREAELQEVNVAFDKLQLEEDEKIEYLQQEDLHNFMKKTVVINLDRLKYESTHFIDEQSSVQRSTRKTKEMEKIEISYENLIQRMRQIRRDNISELIQYHEKKLNQTRWRYESMYDNLWEGINIERLALLQSAEDAKNSKVHEVETIQSKERQEIRQYFNRIAFDCLALIGDLKKELEMLKKNETEQKKALRDAMIENKNLNQNMEDVKDAKLVLDEYKQSKKTFAQNRTTMHVLMDELKDLNFYQHMITQKLEGVNSKIENLNQQFFGRLRKMQQTSSLKSVFLERRVKVLQGMVNEPSASGPEPDQDLDQQPVFHLPLKETKQMVSESNKYPINVVDIRFIEGQVLFQPPANLDS